MERIIKKVENGEEVVNRVAEFIKFFTLDFQGQTTNEKIKELCIMKMLKILGLKQSIKLQSQFLNFFSTIMGEALCEKLNINTRIACDEIRLIRYENVNLVSEMKSYLEKETVEEAFLDSFMLADRYKYLMNVV